MADEKKVVVELTQVQAIMVQQILKSKCNALLDTVAEIKEHLGQHVGIDLVSDNVVAPMLEKQNAIMVIISKITDAKRG